jgi:hypothetical protein
MHYLQRFRCTICNSFNVSNVTHRHVRINGFRVLTADIYPMRRMPRHDAHDGTEREERAAVIVSYGSQTWNTP